VSHGDLGHLPAFREPVPQTGQPDRVGQQAQLGRGESVRSQAAGTMSRCRTSQTDPKPCRPSSAAISLRREQRQLGLAPSGNDIDGPSMSL
jgi:hypothetical protein